MIYFNFYFIYKITTIRMNHQGQILNVQTFYMSLFKYFNPYAHF